MGRAADDMDLRRTVHPGHRKRNGTSVKRELLGIENGRAGNWQRNDGRGRGQPEFLRRHYKCGCRKGRKERQLQVPEPEAEKAGRRFPEDAARNEEMDSHLAGWT